MKFAGMKNNILDTNMSSDMIAAYLDGNLSEEQTQLVLDRLSEDEELREIMEISQAVDLELDWQMNRAEKLPMTALAAEDSAANRCVYECEKYILERLGVIFDDDQLLSVASENWLTDKGTALHNIGRLSEYFGLSVQREYKSDIGKMKMALEQGDGVIVVVDSAELTAPEPFGKYGDFAEGPVPNHAVVVLKVNQERDEILIFNPNDRFAEDVYSLEMFMESWNDSKYYMVTINRCDMKNYVPKPIDLSDVVLTDDLNELREAIAENAHEVWAVERQNQGWSYGPQRDDATKQTPCMVPYSQLPDSEKKFDREMAMNTLKLVKKLGYDIIKVQETDLYKELLSALRDKSHFYGCSNCGTKCLKHFVFCPECGKELNVKWDN